MSNSKPLKVLVIASRASLQTHEGHNAIQEAVLEVAKLIDDADSTNAKLCDAVGRHGELGAELMTCREERAYYKAQTGTLLMQLNALEVEPDIACYPLPDSIADELNDNDETHAPPRLVEPTEPASGG